MIVVVVVLTQLGSEPADIQHYVTLLQSPQKSSTHFTCMLCLLCDLEEPLFFSIWQNAHRQRTYSQNAKLNEDWSSCSVNHSLCSVTCTSLYVALT